MESDAWKRTLSPAARKRSEFGPSVPVYNAWRRFVPACRPVSWPSGAPRRRLLLPPCRQRVSSDGQFHYLGGGYPIGQELVTRACQLARAALAALPRTRGFVGVDMILGESAAGPGRRRPGNQPATDHLVYRSATGHVVESRSGDAGHPAWGPLSVVLPIGRGRIRGGRTNEKNGTSNERHVMNWLALDIGGANLKVADGQGFAASHPFALVEG